MLIRQVLRRAHGCVKLDPPPTLLWEYIPSSSGLLCDGDMQTNERVVLDVVCVTFTEARATVFLAAGGRWVFVGPEDEKIRRFGGPWARVTMVLPAGMPCGPQLFGGRWQRL